MPLPIATNSQNEFIRNKILCGLLQKLANSSSDASQEISRGLSYATTVSLLERQETLDDRSMPSVGGVTLNDIARYGESRVKLSQRAMDALAESLQATLDDVTLYYHGAEELEPSRLKSLAVSLDNDVQADLTRKESDIRELSFRLSTVLNLYEEAAELHPRLHATLQEILHTLPAPLTANHTASHDLLALTIETSLLKLSVVRARIRASLYSHTSSSNPRANMAQAIRSLHGKLLAQQQILDAQEQEVEASLQEYQQLLELVDGQGGGFGQVVEDLATVQKETEDCRKDLRRLGWTES